jgi:hypothetical protein
MNPRAASRTLPFEEIWFTPSVSEWYYVVIYDESTTAPRFLSLRSFSCQFQYFDPDYSVYTPESVDSVNVGAAFWNGLGLEPFSSQGPLFGPGGVPDGALAPQLAGADGVSGYRMSNGVPWSAAEPDSGDPPPARTPPAARRSANRASPLTSSSLLFAARPTWAPSDRTISTASRSTSTRRAVRGRLRVRRHRSLARRAVARSRDDDLWPVHKGGGTSWSRAGARSAVAVMTFAQPGPTLRASDMSTDRKTARPAERAGASASPQPRSRRRRSPRPPRPAACWGVTAVAVSEITLTSGPPTVCGRRSPTHRHRGWFGEVRSGEDGRSVAVRGYAYVASSGSLDVSTSAAVGAVLVARLNLAWCERRRRVRDSRLSPLRNGRRRAGCS